MPFAFILCAALALLFAGLRIARQYERGVVLRFGRYVVYWIVPLIETAVTVDLRIVTSAVSGQEAISRDNVPIKIFSHIKFANA